MDTSEIVDRCRSLPGVTVNSAAGYTELLLSGSDGDGRMRFIPIFHGVTLAQISVTAASWPAPQPERCTPDTKGPLIINYCVRGRCELLLNDNRHVFLTVGHVSLTERFAQNEYIYPGRAYEGIELFIDPDVASAGLPLLRDGFGVDIPHLREKYCPDGETFIAKMQLPEPLLGRLSAPEADLSSVGAKTGVVDFLAMLLQDGAAKQEPQVFYTKTQVEIAKQAERIITADLSKTHAVREFAELFFISESSVKNYFFGVFGQSISQYTLHRRMLLAAELLQETRLPVIEVANRVGYLNQSKFSAAFRREFSRTPLEYRREKNFPAGCD